VFLDNQEINDEQGISEKINNSCIKIVKNVQQYYGVNIFIGISSIGKIDNCWRLLLEAHQSRIGCFFTNKTFVALSHAIAQTDPDAGQQAIKRVVIDYAKLVMYFDTDKKEAILEYIQSIFADIRSIKNYKIVQDAFIDFLSVGKLIHEKYKINEKALINDSMFKYDAFLDILFINDVERYIYELYLSLFYSKLNGQTNYSHIVKSCINFIHNDYKNNIGLSEIAEKIGVSPSYLSFIFKQEAGINFNTALTQYRIEKAKKLLSTTTLRIYQIAEQVGFQNPYYFSKVFEEISGYTCKEYRNKGEESFED
jgi:two-component system response regulator YesN